MTGFRPGTAPLGDCRVSPFRPPKQSGGRISCQDRFEAAIDYVAFGSTSTVRSEKTVVFRESEKRDDFTVKRSAKVVVYGLS